MIQQYKFTASLYKDAKCLSRCKNGITSIVCVRRKSDERSCRNLFEVYQNNSHWMGQYQRHPVLKDKMNQTDLLQMMDNEENRLCPIDLDKYINENRTEWQEGSKRTGAIGRKLGTSVMWTKEGFRHAVTLVRV